MGLSARKMDRIYCYADYRSWPDNERWELIDGIAWNMSPAPSRFHQWIVLEMGYLLKGFLEENSCDVYIAPFDVFFPARLNQIEDEIDTVVQPDLSVICDPEKLTDKGCMGAPDFIVEILSPYTTHKDLNEKYRLYERSGVREYWVVDPNARAILAYRRGENGYYNNEEILEKTGIMKSSVLKGFALDLKILFREPR